MTAFFIFLAMGILGALAGALGGYTHGRQQGYLQGVESIRAELYQARKERLKSRRTELADKWKGSRRS